MCENKVPAGLYAKNILRHYVDSWVHPPGTFIMLVKGNLPIWPYFRFPGSCRFPAWMTVLCTCDPFVPFHKEKLVSNIDIISNYAMETQLATNHPITATWGEVLEIHEPNPSHFDWRGQDDDPSGHEGGGGHGTGCRFNRAEIPGMFLRWEFKHAILRNSTPPNCPKYVSFPKSSHGVCCMVHVKGERKGTGVIMDNYCWS